MRDDTSSWDLGLTVRAVTVLERLGCVTVGDVCALTERDLLTARYSSRRVRDEVVLVLAAHGRELSGPHRGGLWPVSRAACDRLFPSRREAR